MQIRKDTTGIIFNVIRFFTASGAGRFIGRITNRLTRLQKTIALVFLAGILLLLICARKPPVQSNFAVAEIRQLDDTVIEAGEVRAASEIGITAPMLWTDRLQVVDIVPEGTLVRAGDRIVRFDAGQLDASRRLAVEELESRQADLDQLKAQQLLELSNLENALRLAEFSVDQAKLRQGMRQFESKTKQEEARILLDQSLIDIEKTKTQIESRRIIQETERMRSRALVREAENNLRSIDERIRGLEIKAPSDGMIVYRQEGGWEDNQRPSPGYTARPGELLMTIPYMDSMRVRIFVHEIDRGKIKPGQSATVTLDAYPDTVFSGRVVDISTITQAVDWDEGRKGFGAWIAVDGKSPILKPGMSAKVRVVTDSQRGTCIPAAAVFERDGRPVVFFVGKSKPISVTLGIRNDAWVVVEKGIAPGQMVSYTDPAGSAGPLGFAEEERRNAEQERLLNSKTRQSPHGFAEDSTHASEGPGGFPPQSFGPPPSGFEGIKPGGFPGPDFKRGDRAGFSGKAGDDTSSFRRQRRPEMIPDSLRERFRKMFRDSTGTHPRPQSGRFPMTEKTHD
jgi:HlyD family secretion protein